MDQYYLFIILAPIAAIISTSTAIYAWRRRFVPGAFMLSLVLLTNTGWLISSSLELISPTAQTTIFIAKLSYLFILSGPIFSLGFILQYSEKPKWASFPRFLLLFILPTITFFLVQTNEMHGLIWSSYSVVPVNQDLQVLRISSYGLWFWIQVIYTYVLIFTSIFKVATYHFQLDILYRLQSRWLLLGAAIPLIFNVIYILRLIPTLKKDFSPLAFAFSSLAYAIGIFRHRFLEITPIARNIIIENMQESMIVIDRANQIIDINPAARSLLLFSPTEIIGTPLATCLPEAAPLLSKDKPQNQIIEFSIERDKTKSLLEVKLSIIKNAKGEELGYLLTLQDITERKQLFQEIERLASTDTLTNLNNRRHLFTLGEKEIARACRYKHPLSLLIIDIDHFKQINDTYGHLTGDQILQMFSSSLLSTFRSVDIIGRYGGDEFIVILPETPPEAAHATAVRLCETIANRRWQTTIGEIHFTLSIGISTETDVKNDATLSTLLDRADRALYLAKSRGRNQAALEE